MAQDSKDNYNDDPVYYCRRCLSLNIKEMPFVKGGGYCADCNNADIGTTSIEEWEEMGADENFRGSLSQA